MSDQNLTIMACVPANEADRMGVPYDGPNPGSIVVQCEECGIDIWFGPKQKALKEQHPDIPVLCVMCVLKKGDQAAEDDDTTFSLTNLEEMAKFDYEKIDTPEDLEQVVREMHEYARSTEFDYIAARDEAMGDPNVNAEGVHVKVGEEDTSMIRARGKQLGAMAPFTRMLMLGHETLQCSYMEFRANGQWVGQIQIVNNYGLPLDEGAISVAEALLGDGRVHVVEGTPAHVCVAFRPIERE